MQLTAVGGADNASDDAADSTRQRPPRPESGGAHRARRRAFPVSRDDWLVLAERVVGDWTATLRAALLIALALAAVLTTVGLVFGAIPALAGAGLVLVVFLVGRRRGGAAHG